MFSFSALVPADIVSSHSWNRSRAAPDSFHRVKTRDQLQARSYDKVCSTRSLWKKKAVLGLERGQYNNSLLDQTYPLYIQGQAQLCCPQQSFCLNTSSGVIFAADLSSTAKADTLKAMTSPVTAKLTKILHFFLL